MSKFEYKSIELSVNKLNEKQSCQDENKTFFYSLLLYSAAHLEEVSFTVLRSQHVPAFLE